MPNLTVSLAGQEPRWIALRIGDGFCRLLVKPLSTAVMEGARWASRRAMMAAVKDGLDPASPELVGLGQQAFLAALGRAAIIGWEGLDDEAGQPVPHTPDNVAAVLDVPEIAHAFEAAYVQPYAARLAEKNASAPAPNGTSAAGPAIAGDAAPTRVNGAKPALT